MNLILDSALYSTAIFAAACLVALLFNRASADLRHRLWLAAIVAAGALPVSIWLLPARLPQAIRIVVPAAIARPAALSHVMPRVEYALSLWLAVALLLLARIALGYVAIQRITRAATAADDGTLISNRVAAPLTWGVVHPVILLPEYATSWGEEQRTLATNHERAHIARRDWLWQTMARIAAAIFWFQPLMWLALAALRREAEGAADDQVLAGGASAPSYASQLVEVARRMSGANHGATPALAVAMVRGHNLEHRVMAILDDSRNRSRTGRIAQFAIVLGAAALVFPMIAVKAQSNAYKVGNGVTSPSVVYKVEPQYTPEAKDAKIQGPVLLKLEIDENGNPDNIQVVQSLDPGLDANAVSAISQWKFAPGQKDGQPVRVVASIQINFRLE